MSRVWPSMKVLLLTMHLTQNVKIPVSFPLRVAGSLPRTEVRAAGEWHSDEGKNRIFPRRSGYPALKGRIEMRFQSAGLPLRKGWQWHFILDFAFEVTSSQGVLCPCIYAWNLVYLWLSDERVFIMKRFFFSSTCSVCKDLLSTELDSCSRYLNSLQYVSIKGKDFHQHVRGSYYPLEMAVSKWANIAATQECMTFQRVHSILNSYQHSKEISFF